MSEELVPPDFIMSPEFFEETFIQASSPNISQLALDGKLNTIKNRFTAWRIFLGILPKSGPIETWIERITELRQRYSAIIEEQRKVNIDHLDPLIFNPLSQVTNNPWNNFHVDNELKQKIRLDVERTFQERPLFLLPEIQEMMTSILFTWSKLNSDISYRQGMNELLGILLFVGYADVAVDVVGVQNKTKRVLEVLNNKEHLEADVYWCFARLMDLGICELFNPVVTHQNRQKNKKDLFTWDAEKTRNDLVNQDKSQEQSASSILRRCHKVHHQLLQNTDRDLFNHIENKKIEPQMYLQRWLRCMLCREFNLADTLELWDAIFANYFLEPEKEFILLDYLCVAMIVFVRAFLLQSDHSGILKRLLKFPPVEDVHILVGMAIKFKSRETTPPSRSFAKPSISPLKSSFSQPKKLLSDKPNINTIHSGKPAPISFLDEAIQIIQESISEKNFDSSKQNRAVDLVNKVKNLLEHENCF